MYAVHCIYILTCSELLVPLVNMIKEGCENKCASLIFFIFFFQSQNSKLSLENNNLKKGGGVSLWNKSFFLKYMLDPITGTPRNSYE